MFNKFEGSTVFTSSPIAIVVKDDADFKEFLKLTPHDYHEFMTNIVELH